MVRGYAASYDRPSQLNPDVGRTGQYGGECSWRDSSTVSSRVLRALQVYTIRRRENAL